MAYMSTKPKQQMEYPDSPSGYVTLYNYKEPLMPFVGGYGYQGVLLFDGETDKVQCHLCGDWFHAVGNHLGRQHGMLSRDYKKMAGLRQSTALIGEAYRAKLIETGMEKRKRNLRPGGKTDEATKEKIRKTLKDVRAEKQNEEGTCPRQLIDRLQKLAAELGRTPHTDEVIFYGTLVKVYGSFKRAVRLAGLKYRKPGQNVRYNASRRYTDDELLGAIRDFAEREGREPAISDIRRALFASKATYRKHFGSWKIAKKIALADK